MSKHIKFSAIIILFVFLSSCKHKVTQSDYPDSDAVFLKIAKEYTLNEDGTMDYHYIQKLKLFSFVSFNGRYGETFIVYNPAFQKLKINKALTTQEKGNEIAVPENAKNDLLPPFAANAPAYNGLREMVITHTGLEKNASIELDYNITSQKGFQPALMSNEVLNNSSPVREYEIIVKVPKSKKLYYKLLNSDIKPDSSSDSKYITYKWNFKELQAQSVDAMQPSDNRHLVRLLFSTLSEPTFVYSYDLNDAVKKEINEIKHNVETLHATSLHYANFQELNLTLALQKKVVEEFNYFPIPSIYVGYKSRTAEAIWQSNGGNELEKAVLLNSLLKTAGINSEILAVSSPYFGVKDNIRMLFDNYYVKAALKNNEIIYLSPIHVNDFDPVHDMQGYLYYPLDVNSKMSNLAGFQNLRGLANSNTIDVKGNLNLKNDNTLSGSIIATYTNKFNPYYRYTINPESAKGAFSNVKEAKLTSLSKDKSVVDITLENKKAYQKEKNYMFFNVPEANGGVSSWGLNTLTEKRNTPLELNSDIDESYNYTIQMPTGWKLESGSGKLEINLKNNAGFANINIEQKGSSQAQNDNKIVVKKEIKISNKVTEAKDYNDLRTLINTWNNKKYRELVISQ
jgi:hypothetical protein